MSEHGKHMMPGMPKMKAQRDMNKVMTMKMPGDNNTPSKKAQGFISHKIGKLMHEGKSQKAAVGQAYGMARQKGYRV